MGSCKYSRYFYTELKNNFNEIGQQTAEIEMPYKILENLLKRRQRGNV